MRTTTLCFAAALALGSIGLATATPTNMVQNGDFSQTSPGRTNPTQFGANSGNAGSPSCHWGGQFVSNWTGNTGYMVWYPSATAASTVSACTQYGNASTQQLPPAVTAPPVGSGSFLGLDGQQGIRASISQTINGLTAGAKYTLNFYWASTQEESRTGPTTEKLQVSFAGQTFTTPTNALPTHGWSGWAPQSFTFTAGNSSEILNFLSIGTPSGLPPFALLAGVSLTQAVPEPSALAMFGGGLLGLGLIVVFARRRRQHELDATDVA